jgi:hypothetical protein
MVKPLILNSSNLVNSDYQNIYQYSFPKGSVSFKNDFICLSNLNIFYSWYNITSSTTFSRYGNNTFQYVWYVGGSGTTYDVVLPDGTYEIADINAYFQSVMYDNGHYLINSGGNVFYMELVANQTTGLVQFNSYVIPSSLPSGFTAPGTWPGYPSSPITPQIIVPSAFNSIIGFDVGTFPVATQNTNYSITSTTTPQISPLNSIIILCSVANNDYAIPSTIIYSFPALTGAQFGSLITIQPSEFAFVPIKDGTYTDFTISFVGQDYSPVYIADSNLVMQLLIKNRDEYNIK